jgi:hypothetical protein
MPPYRARRRPAPIPRPTEFAPVWKHTSTNWQVLVPCVGIVRVRKKRKRQKPANSTEILVISPAFLCIPINFSMKRFPLIYYFFW